MQRVAIGRAIVRRPKLFLMDEPLTNLDAKLREALRVELVQLRRQLKTPMIFVTHDQAEALSMGDRIAVLSEGRILQTGAPEEIYRRPATPEVARQLGQPPINLIPVRRQGGQWTREGIGLIEATEGVESEAILGVRPEDIDPLGGSHDAQVRVVEDMGATRTLLIRWAGCDLHIVTPKSFSARPGDTIRPVLQAARVVVWGAA
jgi:multiple sugar transport system ATP-binding protein